MPPVDWATILAGTGASVVYSSMSIPDDRGSDGVVAEIGLPNDHFIDISWFRQDESYRVRLYREFFENLIGREYVCAAAQSAIDIAKDLARSTCIRPTKVSSSL